MMRFRYPVSMFIIRSLALFIFLGIVDWLMVSMELSGDWILGFSLVFGLAIFITMLTPVFTSHEINSQGIILRQGLLFRLSFPFSSVESVESFRSPGFLFGLVSRRDRIMLASTTRGLVRIKLNHRKRFGMLLLRRAEAFIIDLREPERFIKMAREYIPENFQGN